MHGIQKFKSGLCSIDELIFIGICGWANFNQSWYKASSGEEDSSFFNWKKNPINSHKVNDVFFSSLNQCYDIIICVYWFEMLGAHGPLDIKLELKLCIYYFDIKYFKILKVIESCAIFIL